VVAGVLVIDVRGDVDSRASKEHSVMLTTHSPSFGAFSNPAKII
jgi:hypothetical protein